MTWTNRMLLTVVAVLLHICCARACEPDHLVQGCRYDGTTCVCGLGCDTIFRFSTRDECEGALKSADSTDVLFLTKCPSKKQCKRSRVNASSSSHLTFLRRLSTAALAPPATATEIEVEEAPVGGVRVLTDSEAPMGGVRVLTDSKQYQSSSSRLSSYVTSPSVLE
ncbi:uncharacterized protein LOC143033946 isoform X1 [Oratosquilla oratoria]|uniref:uncharacterized protein LOC143033946 isoform X1 n=1 Tax=Oratosquilla oratoria TaxID=337810 RepID=UPI003F760B5E